MYIYWKLTLLWKNVPRVRSAPPDSETFRRLSLLTRLISTSCTCTCIIFAEVLNMIPSLVLSHGIISRNIFSSLFQRHEDRSTSSTFYQDFFFFCTEKTTCKIDIQMFTGCMLESFVLWPYCWTPGCFLSLISHLLYS